MSKFFCVWGHLWPISCVRSITVVVKMHISLYLSRLSSFSISLCPRWLLINLLQHWSWLQCRPLYSNMFILLTRRSYSIWRVGEVLLFEDSYFCLVSDCVKLAWFTSISPYYVIRACIVSGLLQAISSLQKCSINWNGGSKTPERPKAKVGPLPTLALDTRLHQIQKLLIKTLFALCLIKWRFFYWGSFDNIVIVSVVQLVTFWTTSCVSHDH